MLRFYDVGSGRILIDNQDIREMPIQALRAKIGYVPQQSVLLPVPSQRTSAMGRKTLQLKSLKER